MPPSTDIVKLAHAQGAAIPAFNVPYLPMIPAVVRAVVDQDCVAMIATARLEWFKFEGRSLAAVAEAYAPHARPGYTWLHLDHIPVIDEDGQNVDYLPLIREALDVGYQSVMIDGSRLDLLSNISVTRAVADLAHAAGCPCEAELGAVLGHEAGPLPPYEELFRTGQGFTRLDEAELFASESGCDWLSVAIGNIHGAVSAAAKGQKKVEARLDLDHLQKLNAVTRLPLVLHGGSGVQGDYLRAAITRGIAKVNIGTEIRQAYEEALAQTGDVAAAQSAVYERTCWLIREWLGLAGLHSRLSPPAAD
jgi:fructose-bisphosphate aldolase class II